MELVRLSLKSICKTTKLFEGKTSKVVDGVKIPANRDPKNRDEAPGELKVSQGTPSVYETELGNEIAEKLGVEAPKFNSAYWAQFKTFSRKVQEEVVKGNSTWQRSVEETRLEGERKEIADTVVIANDKNADPRKMLLELKLKQIQERDEVIALLDQQMKG